MKEASPTKGAGSDESHRARSLQDSPSGTPWPGVVRTGSSNADDIQLSATPTGASRSQSEGDLAVPEAAERRAEGRPSGKSAAKRSEARETTGGRGGELSAGWREVAEQLHAEEGTGHE